MLINGGLGELRAGQTGITVMTTIESMELRSASHVLSMEKMLRSVAGEKQ